MKVDLEDNLEELQLLPFQEALRRLEVVDLAFDRVVAAFLEGEDLEVAAVVEEEQIAPSYVVALVDHPQSPFEVVLDQDHT